MPVTAIRGARPRGSQECGSAHAVVLGASVAGLAMAKALRTRFAHVTVVDRDSLPSDGAHRRGVPQARHLHVLLTPGKAALEELFPGLVERLAAGGAVLADLGERGRMWVNGKRLALGPTGPADVSATRPFLERHIRALARADAAITFLDRHEGRGLVVDDGGQQVVGLRVAARPDGAERMLPADLVVDCSGRSSRVPSWLAELGYPSPQVEQLRVDLRYVTRHYRLPDDVLDGDLLAMVGPLPHDPRAGWLARVEHDRWTLTLAGLGGVRPPTDPDRFEAFAATLATPVLHAAIRRGQALDDPVAFRYPASTRHRYDRLRRFPAGLLVAGDAVCSFNPIYGQGMTVAALEAVAVRGFLAAGQVPSARAWFRAINPIIDAPWDLAVGGDLAIACIEGHRTLATRLLNRYLDRYVTAAQHDPVLGVRFARVTSLLDPPSSLLRPASVGRVIAGNARARSVVERSAGPPPERPARPAREPTATQGG